MRHFARNGFDNHHSAVFVTDNVRIIFNKLRILKAVFRFILSKDRFFANIGIDKPPRFSIGYNTFFGRAGCGQQYNAGRTGIDILYSAFGIEDGNSRSRRRTDKKVGALRRPRQRQYRIGKALYINLLFSLPIPQRNLMNTKPVGFVHSDMRSFRMRRKQFNRQIGDLPCLRS